MVRAGLSAGAAHAFMLVTPGGNGLAFQRRRSADGTTTHTPGGAGGGPVWVKLTRAGSTIAAFRSADGVTWTEVGRDTFSLPGTVYVGVAVTSHDNAVLNAATFEQLTVVEGSAAAWSHRDIGAVGAAGDATASANGWSVTGSGADIWGSRDAFHYAYTPVAGDVVVTARVAAIEHVDPWTKAGIMIRASTGADAVHASLWATPTSANGVAFQRRTTRGGPSSHTAGPSLAPAIWLRLTRQGGTITAAYRRSSGDRWTTFASESFATLPSSVLVGVAVTSHEQGTRATAAFEGVTIQGGPVQ
jgi:regulation of enolase protein 1 (concanavalin A-like superfamily)